MKTFKQLRQEYTIRSMTCDSTIPEVIDELLAVQNTYDLVTVTIMWDTDTWTLKFQRPEG